MDRVADPGPYFRCRFDYTDEMNNGLGRTIPD